MAPTSENKRAKAIRASERQARDLPPAFPWNVILQAAGKDAKVARTVLPWTVGDDSEVEEEPVQRLKGRRRTRRQDQAPGSGDSVPPPQSQPPAGAEATPLPIDDESSSDSFSDGISSDTSDSGGEEETVESRPPPSGDRGTPGLPPPPPPTSGELPSATDAPSPAQESATSTSASSSSSSTSVLIPFSTLIPGGSLATEIESIASITSLSTIETTIATTISEAGTTYTSVFTETTTEPVVEATTILLSSGSEISTATRAAQASGTAEADTDASPTPQFIRVHEHPHGLSKDAIHGLIAFGTLGGLMGFLAVVWFFWRRSRRSNRHLSVTPKSRPDTDESFFGPSRRVRMLQHIPFLKDRFAGRSWFTIDEPYHSGEGHDRGDGFLEKSAPLGASAQSNSRLDSQFFSPNQVMGIAVRVQAGDNPPIISQNAVGENPPSYNATGIGAPTLAPLGSHAVRQQKTAPFPTYPIKRSSALSSLSSGFGDGDILQPPPSARYPESVAGSRRDTVYTEASEDQPPRFRNVNSWVRQQTGRVKRSQARARDEEDAPPVPQMPDEVDYGMMLPDGEEPRRVQ